VQEIIILHHYGSFFWQRYAIDCQDADPMNTDTGTGPIRRRRTVLEIVAYIIASTVLIFSIDASTPLGLMVWILYFIPLFLTLYIRWKYAPFLATSVFILLIGISYFVSPRDMSEFFALVNRLFFSLMLIALSFFIWNHNRNMATLWINEERYRNMAECSPDAIIVYKEGKILYANPSSQRLFSVENNKDLLGKDIIDLFDPAEQNTIRQKISHGIIGMQIVIDKVRMLRLNGTEFFGQVSLGKIIWDHEPALLANIRVVTDS
jgi:PAS domain S-box-containing protein